MGVLTNQMLRILPQYVSNHHVSNHHSVQFKYLIIVFAIYTPKLKKKSLQRVQSHMTSLVNLCLKRMNTHFLKNLRALKLAIDRCHVCKAVTPKGILFLVYHCKDIYQASAISWSCDINVLLISKNYQGELVFEVVTKILTTVELLPWS